VTPNQAGQRGRAFEPFDLLWLEDCTPGPRTRRVCGGCAN
jgi:L-alanine-DL-glutamate epimerase-like enolase superfamily enzyme